MARILRYRKFQIPYGFALNMELRLTSSPSAWKRQYHSHIIPFVPSMSSYLPITKLSDIMTPKLISKNITAAIRPSSAGLLSIVNWFLRYKHKNHAMLEVTLVCLMIQSMSLPRKKFASSSLSKEVFLTAIKNNGSYQKKCAVIFRVILPLSQ